MNLPELVSNIRFGIAQVNNTCSGKRKVLSVYVGPWYLWPIDLICGRRPSVRWESHIGLLDALKPLARFADQLDHLGGLLESSPDHQKELETPILNMVKHTLDFEITFINTSCQGLRCEALVGGDSLVSLQPLEQLYLDVCRELDSDKVSV